MAGRAPFSMDVDWRVRFFLGESDALISILMVKRQCYTSKRERERDEGGCSSTGDLSLPS